MDDLAVLLERDQGKFGKLSGHVARNNPHHAAFDGSQPALIVFQGTHRYISPAWYDPDKPAVPTWNFAVVHCSGRPKAFDDDARSAALLETLVGHFESYENAQWDLSRLPENYLKGLRQGIVPFEMEIESIEGKFKLGQERSERDRTGVLEGLAAAKPERSLLEFTLEHYERIKL